MDIKLFDYDLPREMIAQEKSDPRDDSRLFLIDASSSPNVHSHHRFRDLPELMEKGDLLVLNRSRVIPARVEVTKETGGKGEVLLLRMAGENAWEALVGGRRIKAGDRLTTSDPPVSIVVNERLSEGKCNVSFKAEGSPLSHSRTLEWLRSFGLMPTPPYIRRLLEDPEEYQTVYSKVEGSVAAPTAGLHFTDELM
ncbi:MAG: S-adenosylmethionine:tRNA ribosyltransferase-isomerase, partial [Thermoplasmata archaeon]|nr:S-adenosylmethionine:tRNA ribosyltransferase-isomerase [Thermoplasmata archaeon]